MVRVPKLRLGIKILRNIDKQIGFWILLIFYFNWCTFSKKWGKSNMIKLEKYSHRISVRKKTVLCHLQDRIFVKFRGGRVYSYMYYGN